LFVNQFFIFLFIICNYARNIIQYFGYDRPFFRLCILTSKKLPLYVNFAAFLSFLNLTNIYATIRKGAKLIDACSANPHKK
jgi:hypothetical protein